MESILVSACLLGVNCRYDGKNSLNTGLIELSGGKNIIPVCPEQFGGLPTPRSRSEIEKGDGGDVYEGNSRILNEDGKDVTDDFIKGAKETLKVARMFGVRKAYFKEMSPSCGVKNIKRKGELVKGMGVTAYLLKKEGIEVVGV